MLLNPLAHQLPLGHTCPAPLGALALWLPSLVHTWAFCLLTAAALQAHGRTAWGVCAAWWLLECGFEALQHAPWKDAASATFERWGAWAPVTQTLFEPLAHYVRAGRFDMLDLLAISAGALLAAGWLQHTPPQEPMP